MPRLSPQPQSVASSVKHQRLLRVLHVGVANRGLWPLQRCNESTGFQPAALCDINPSALASARELTGLKETDCYTDFDRALANADVDCVIICAPTVLHVPLAKKCIAAGKPVLIEKGMAPDWASAQELVRVATEANAIVAVAQNYRYNAPERTIHRAINDSQYLAYLGPVHMIEYTQYRVRPKPRTLTYPFASVWDMSCHHFDNLLSWLGPVREMTAHSWRATWSPYEHDNNTSAHILFENGTHVHYIHTHDAARNVLELQIHGERGAVVRVDNSITFNERPTEQFGSRPIVELQQEPAEGESDLLRDFHAWIVEGTEPGISVRNNLETMAACEMMVRSIREKRTVRREELS